MKAKLEELLLKVLLRISNTPKEFETAWTGTGGTYTANCVKIGDLKIQWGIIHAISGQFHSVYFKVPFEGLGYYAMASYTSNADVTITPGNNAYITGQRTDYCRIRTNGGNYCWLCIGY